MLLKYHTCLIIFVIVLESGAFESTTVAIVDPSITTLQNSSSKPDLSESKVFYACDEPHDFYKDICHCYWNHLMKCDGRRKTLFKTTNIIIKNETFVLKKAEISVNLNILEKDKILPGREHTIEELKFCYGDINKVEEGAFDKFTKLSSLSLTFSQVSNIDDRILTKTVGTTLTSLNLNYNYFNSLSPNTFKNLQKLTFLDLGSNNISSSLTKELFSKSLSNLKELKLNECNITAFNVDAFIHLRNLESLSLKKNPLTSIPKAISVLSKLNYLNMDTTQITILTNNAFNKNLKHLDMTYLDNFKIIDDCAFCGFPNLKELYIHQNWNLERIHENAFGAFVGRNVSKLEKLNAHKCKLAILPEKLLDWEVVKEIYIDNNPFICNCSMAWLINDFANPKPKYYKNIRGQNLTCHGPLKLQGQSFQDVAGTVCMRTNTIIDNRIPVCEKLYDQNEPCVCEWHKLDCSSDSFDPKKIVSLNLKIEYKDYVLKNISFFQIPLKALRKGKIVPGREHTIEEIDLNFNEISHIDDGVFDSFVFLKTLKLKQQNLQTLNNSFLTQKLGSTLIELFFEQNELQTISPNAFKYLTKLEKLSLHFNRGIQNSLTKELFSENLKALKSLDLSVCGISSLKEDVFENLINLEELQLHLNPLTAIPTAINALTNLRLLSMAITDVVHLKNNGINILPQLETLKMIRMRYLQTIDDCAFCPFPNLKNLMLSGSRHLEKIHENAFGAASGTNMPKLKNFAAVECNTTVFPEKLLNWDTIDEFHITYNQLICNCSMAWLINDFAYSNKKYVPKMKLNEYSWHKETLECAGPPELKGKIFKEISNTLCNTSFTQIGIFDRYEETNSFWFLPIAILIIMFGIFIIGLIAFIFYCKRTKSLEKSLSTEEVKNPNEEVALSNL